MKEELKKLSEDKNNLVNFKNYFEDQNSLKIKLPLLRKISKKMASSKNYSFFDERHYYFEEYIIHAYAIGYLKEDINLCIKYAKEFIPQINNWAVNDCFCQNLKWARVYPQETISFLKEYVDSNKEFEIRVVLVTLLSHFLIDEFIDEVFTIIDKVKVNDYMSKMAMAWLLATLMAKYRDRTLEYLKNTKVDNWTYNKAIQKMIESFRVSENDKELLKTLKRR